jgi:hypothetical protein
MDTEQPDTGSEASIEDRLSAVFAPEAAEEAPVETPVVEETTEETPVETVEETAEGEWIDVEDDSGKAHKVPAALKDAFERRADYTRKTQAAANLSNAAQDRLFYAEAREQFQGAVSKHVEHLAELRATLKQYENVDSSQLDMQTAWAIRDKRDEIRRQLEAGERQLAQANSQLQALADQHAEKQWKLAVDGAVQRIGSYTPGEDAAMLKLVQSLGFSERELKTRFADSRFLQMAHKAAKWDVLQAQKPKAQEAAKSAPPVLKPGASKGANVVAEQKYRDQRAQLKKSGSVNDAAALFLMKGRK